jgi:hypothetical protein
MFDVRWRDFITLLGGQSTWGTSIRSRQSRITNPEGKLVSLSNFDRYQRIAWARDLLDLPCRYRKIRPLLFRALSGLILEAGVGTGRFIF